MKSKILENKRFQGFFVMKKARKLNINGSFCELHSAEPREKPEWFRRFICFGIEKKSTEYLIVPFADMEITINKAYHYK